MGWQGSTQYRILSGQLAEADYREFERRVLPIIRSIWPEATAPPQLRWLDRSGIDIMIWSDKQPFPLVVQCKGFQELDENIGDSQIQQCLKSIASFRNSGLRANHYLLVHNRTNKNKDFRLAVGAALDELVKSGQVGSAELWERSRLLNEAHEAILKSLLDSIEKKQRHATDHYGEKLPYEPIEQVPFKAFDLTIDANHLLKQSKASFFHSDPSEEMLSTEGSNIIVVIGEAGYGKTTASLRTVTRTNQHVLYVPASSIPRGVNSTSALLKHCMKVGNLLDDVPPFNTELFDRIGPSIIHYVFKQRMTPVTLILDGLDESVYFGRRGGLQSLFNQVREILMPVVFTARTEFWTQRLVDFADIFGDARKQNERHHRRVRLIELLPWDNADIASLARRYRSNISQPDQMSRLDELIKIIENDEYGDIYGDIPRRPLFLGFILETVSEQGVKRTGRAQLYYDWALMKIRRDIQRPMNWGTVGRQAIVSSSESTDVTIRLSFTAMMLAAFKMCRRVGSSIELLPDCAIDEIISSDERLQDIHDPTGLFLNSLLLPTASGLPHLPLRVRFGHRAYQEFFLALYVYLHLDEFEDVQFPDSVKELITDLETEGIGSRL